MNLYRNDNQHMDSMKFEFEVTNAELARIDKTDFDWYKTLEAARDDLISDQLHALMLVAEAVESSEP